MDETAVASKIERAARAVASLREHAPELVQIGDALWGVFRAGGRLYTMGNGGSAAEAMHLAEELIGKYRAARAPFAAVCLNADAAALTCIANDFGYDAVFERQVDALVRPGDAVLAFSTSGNSPNIVRALRAARARGGAALAFLGKGGGEALAHCDRALVVADDATEHVQEAHQVALHLLLEIVEARAREGT